MREVQLTVSQVASCPSQLEPLLVWKLVPAAHHCPRLLPEAQLCLETGFIRVI